VEVILVYRDEALGKAWRGHFAEEPKVRVVHDDITSVASDAVVSPANSFGFMDGGLDQALSERFGWDLQQRLQQEIVALPERELLVGQALAVPTGDASVPWLIAAPTMRVPMSFQIATSVNAYLAMRAILIAAERHPEIETVAVPGLCTGVGRMPVAVAALQMFTAFDEVILGHRPVFEDFGDAQKHQIELNPDGLIWDY